MKRTLIVVACVFFLGSVLAYAGDASSSGVPKIIVLTREDIKFAKMATHDALARQVRQEAQRSGADFRWVAGRPVAGNSSEFFSINFYDSFAEAERGFEAFNKVIQTSMQNAGFARDSQDVHSAGRTQIARLREDLSYNLPRFDVANARRWEVKFTRVKPGWTMDLEGLIKESIDIHKKNNIDTHWVTYEVAYGGAGPALITLRALKSLADLDVDHSEAYRTAFTPATRRQFSSVVKEAVLFSESTIIDVRPEVSRPPEKLVAANPSFWTVPEEPQTAAAAKEKKGTVQPAAIRKPN